MIVCFKPLKVKCVKNLKRFGTWFCSKAAHLSMFNSNKSKLMRMWVPGKIQKVSPITSSKRLLHLGKPTFSHSLWQ